MCIRDSTYGALHPAARIRRVRIPVLILVLVMLAVGAARPATADVIHLKNGRTIWADQVRETKDHVEYDLGEDTYAIAKSSVDHIDAGGVAPVRGLSLIHIYGFRCYGHV